MSAKNRIRALNLGMQNVALAEFHTAPDGSLTLQQLQFSELLADPGADASRPGQLEATIAQLKSSMKIQGGEINYALPSQAAFTRYLGLPGSTAEDLNQIIAFEAQQNIPFPIDEVVWDYQPLGAPVDGRLNVVLLAIKTDILEATNRAVEAAGFEPQVIDVAPMALLNAFRYNYPEFDGCSLLVDIGARTTNLIFIEGDKAYTRSIPIGGNTITTAVAKEFGQPVEAAELVKKEKGFVGLGGSYSEPEDEVVARLSKLSRTTLTRLHAEIARSVSFYRANQGGAQPLRVLLAGGAVSMPYMLEFFGEKMQMPVEFFNPLRNVRVAPTVDAQLLSSHAHSLGEVVGLALRSLGNCPVEINLRPASVVSAQSLAKRKPYLIAATVCVFLALIQCAVYFTKAASVESRVLNSVNADVATLNTQAQKFDQLKKAQSELEAVASPLLTASLEREIWLRIIDELGTKLPPQYIWITKLTPMSNGAPVEVPGLGGGDQNASNAAPAPTPTSSHHMPGRKDAAPSRPAIDAIAIQGLYFDNPEEAKVIDDFVNNLQTSEFFAISPSDRTKIVTQRSTPDEDSWAYTYSLILPLKNPIALP